MTIRFKHSDAVQDKAEAFVEIERSLSSTLSMMFPDAQGLAAQLAGAQVSLDSLFAV